ncbi:MAG: hypothetical protein IKW58_00895 [Alphaproteobacteria bacterium]|nr:hypothetical protein [Alphaproteobacteria bacterium]
MGKREELVQKLKEDTKLAWEYIIENAEDFSVREYLSAKNRKRLKKRINKKIRKKYQELPGLYKRTSKFFPRLLKKSKKQISKYAKEYLQSKNLKTAYKVVKDTTLFSGKVFASYVIFSLLLTNDESSSNLKPAQDLYEKNKLTKEQTDALIDKKMAERKRKNIEKNKKEYYEKKSSQDTISVKPPNKLNDEIEYLASFMSSFSSKPEVKDIEQEVQARYLKAKGVSVGESISLSDLMTKAKVNASDIQSAISKNPEILFKLIPGNTNKKLAKAADQKHGIMRGDCLAGVQDIFDKAGLQNIISGGAPNWPKKLKGCKNNSAYNAYVPLEKNGGFIIVSLENKAYETEKGSKENREMQEFCKKLIPGQIVITDNKVPDEQEHRSYTRLQLEYGTGGKVHGHIAVKDNQGYFKSDGTEPRGPNFTRYGNNVKFPLSKDIHIPKDIALEIIKESEEMSRLKQQNKETYTAENIFHFWQNNYRG